MASTRFIIAEEMSSTDISAFFTSRPSQMVQLTGQKEKKTRIRIFGFFPVSKKKTKTTHFDHRWHNLNSAWVLHNRSIHKNYSPNTPAVIPNCRPNCSYNPLHCLWWCQSIRLALGPMMAAVVPAAACAPMSATTAAIHHQFHLLHHH